MAIGYFEPGSDSTDALPVYELTFLFFENGVSRKLFIDYGEFSMRGELKEITFHPPSKCEQKSSAEPSAQPPTTQMDRRARAAGRHARVRPLGPTATPHRARRRRRPTAAA